MLLLLHPLSIPIQQTCMTHPYGRPYMLCPALSWCLALHITIQLALHCLGGFPTACPTLPWWFPYSLPYTALVVSLQLALHCLGGFPYSLPYTALVVCSTACSTACPTLPWWFSLQLALQGGFLSCS